MTRQKEHRSTSKKTKQKTEGYWLRKRYQKYDLHISLARKLLESDKFLRFCELIIRSTGDRPLAQDPRPQRQSFRTILEWASGMNDGIRRKRDRTSQKTLYRYFEFLDKFDLVDFRFDGRRTFFAVNPGARQYDKFHGVVRLAAEGALRQELSWLRRDAIAERRERGARALKKRKVARETERGQPSPSVDDILTRPGSQEKAQKPIRKKRNSTQRHPLSG